MNKCLLGILLSVLVINVAFKPSDGMAVGDRSVLKSQHDGIKRVPMQRVQRNCTTDGAKYRCRSSASSSVNELAVRKASARSTTEQLFDEEFGTYWIGLITIGTPGQTFYIDFDTGSSDLWAPGPQCGSSCGGTHILTSSASSTYRQLNKNFFISYGDGSSVSGKWATDTVNIAGISVANQPFAVISSANGMNAGQSDGILGMGYPQLAHGGEYPVVWAMYLAGQLQQPVFGFWFGPVSTGSDTGELILGGYDTTKYTGPFTYAPVTVKGYWEFVADSVVLTLGSRKTTVATSINAILDSGTTVAMVAPRTVADKMNSIIGGRYDPNSGLYIVDCRSRSLSEFPNITVNIGGTPFTLTPLMYIRIIGDSSGYQCYSVISPADGTDPNGESFWILGDYFMRHFYSVFDMQNNRIGLALSTSYSIVQNIPSGLFPSKKGTLTSILPSQCSNYETISDPTRLTTAPTGTGCDDSSVFNGVGVGSPTYVRFVSPGGTRLATSPPNRGDGQVCGTLGSGWSNASYSSIVGTTVNAIVCFAYNGNPCIGYIPSISITNCNGYYVHGLYSLGQCNYRYCTQ